MNFKKLLSATSLASLGFFASATALLAAGVWMGVTWNDPYGSSSVVGSNLEVTTGSCSTTSCWGAAHYNTPTAFRDADTPWVKYTFEDAGPGYPGPQLWMEDETYGGCYGLNTGTCGAWTQFGAWERADAEYASYRIYWWDYDTAGDGFIETGVPRTAGEHALLLAMRADGTVDYWLDNQLVHSGDEITPNYFGDIYLAGHSDPDHLADSGVVTYTGYMTGTDYVAPPTDKDECKNGGWENFPYPGFKNQGDCVSYVQSNHHAVANKEK